MINSCFIHCHGVGPETDSRLRSLGFNTWEECFTHEDRLPFRSDKKKRFVEYLDRSIRALAEEDISFFIESYPAREHWRVLGNWFEKATFFDIETTGLSWYSSHPSVIAAFRAGKLYTFVYDENLDDFLDFLDESEFLVTFNGGSFDLPFVEKYFCIPKIEIPHADLRWVAYHMGYRGGLKVIEKELGVDRPSDLTEVDGFEAVELFYKWQDGNTAAGETLIRYCSADVVSTFLCACELLNMRGYSIKPCNRIKDFSVIDEIFIKQFFK